MVTSPATLHGAALIAHSYHIDIVAKNHNEYLSDICIVEGLGAGHIAHQSRSPLRAAADFLGNNLEWHSTDRRGEPYLRLRLQPDAAIEDSWNQEVEARDIFEKITMQGGSRVPKNKEAQSMARVKIMARDFFPSLASKHQTHFKIISSRNHDTCTARLYTGDRGMLIATGVGDDHFEAMVELQEEVGLRAARREREEMRAQESGNPYKSQGFF